MAFRDLRDWIDRLDKEGDLLRITDEISLEPDVGAMGRATCDIEGPAILAERIAGYETPLATCLHAAWRRGNMALGLPAQASHRQQFQAFTDAYSRYPVKARLVSDGPCKENVLAGDKVNLFQFPIPRINLDDASFYISKTMCISRDPDTGQVNVGMYRIMVLDRDRTAVCAMSPMQHIRRHWRKYMQAGKQMELAVALGTEPVLPMVACMKIPAEWNEYDYAGAVRGEPEELLKAETVDLPVPAGAEIVLEGILRTDTTVLEGPFGEHTGAYSGCFFTPVFEVKCITHRNNPIYDCLFQGKPPAEQHFGLALGTLAGVWQEMRAKFPQITDMAFYDMFTCVVIQGRWEHIGEPKRAMNALWGSSMGYGTKMVVTVDEDIDPWNAADVLWAITKRCQADGDVVIIPGCDWTLDPARHADGTTCKMGIDATKARPPIFRHRPAGWITPPDGTEEWKTRILKQWKG